MTIRVYKDTTANSIFIEDANGAQFLNSLQASVDDNNKVRIMDLAKNFDIVSNVAHTIFVDKDNNPYTGTAIDVCNELNTMFQAAGTPTSNPPVITSSLNIELTAGETLNYELTADYGVGYEWDFSNVQGITTVNGNDRKLIGGSSLAEGTYSIPVTAINYNDKDSQTITLTVSSPPFSNTKSIFFANQDYLGANAAQLENILGRVTNGGGSSDAWSISLYFFPSTNSQGQTIFYFGDNDANNGGYIQLMQLNNSGNKAIRLRYGSNNNCLRMQTVYGSITPNTWQHLLITYDGGSTGSSSGSLSDYYGRFKLFVNAALPSRSDSHVNYGYTGGVDADNLRVGRFTSGNYMRDCKVDELAIFDSDQSANVSDIYNGGVPFDLTTLTVPPKHWWRMGDGDTYPYLQDNGTGANCIFQMYNMTAANIINDVP